MKRKELEQADSLLTETDVGDEPKLKEQRVSDNMNNQRTSANSEKYDRQIRLWGEDGQEALENANVCLVNVTALGTEILKCLVLPGIGKFTIVDEGKITAEDVGANFFLSNVVGNYKAESACEMLQELNPDTVSSYLCQNPMELLENNPHFYEQFSIVICSRLSEQNLLKLGKVLWHSNVPLVLCDSFGFLGYMRLINKEHLIIKAQPDNALEDFRLDCPSVELQSYMKDINLDEMDKLEHSHTPYLILLYKYLQEWREETKSQWPSSYSEKRQIRDMIRNGIRKNEFGVPELEENFDEAIKNCNSAFTSTRIPEEISEILNKSLNSSRFNANERNLKFWILIEAMKEFVKIKCVLPVRGSLPDMFSDSKRYIELQNIYKNMANNDAEQLSELVTKCLQDHKLPSSLISFDEVKVFCKNVFFLRAISGLSLQDEMKVESGDSKLKCVIEPALSFGGGAEIYIVFRALSRFQNTGRYPFTTTDDGSDMQQLTAITDNLIQEISVSISTPVDYFQELMRCKMSDVHAVASIFGGMCSHEIIKIITKQFVPVDNALCFNGMTQVCSSIKL